MAILWIVHRLVLAGIYFFGPSDFCAEATGAGSLSGSPGIAGIDSTDVINGNGCSHSEGQRQDVF